MRSVREQRVQRYGPRGRVCGCRLLENEAEAAVVLAGFCVDVLEVAQAVRRAKLVGSVVLFEEGDEGFDALEDLGVGTGRLGGEWFIGLPFDPDGGFAGVGRLVKGFFAVGLVR
jgi:hypothetical protein